MSYTTPIVGTVIPFDATKQYRYSITYIGDQYTHIQYEILTNDSAPVSALSKTVETYAHECDIPSNSLTNGSEYKIRVRVGNNIVWSDWSPFAVFRCYSPAVIAITSVSDGGIIRSQSHVFLGSYAQTETDALMSYRFILYNAQQIPIYTQPETFDGLLKCTINILDNSKAYRVELRCISASGVETASPIVGFTAIYVQPAMSSVIELSNDEDNGRVKIDANLVQRTGFGSGFTYQNDDWIDLTASNAYVNFTDGMEYLDDDFTLYLWLKVGSQSKNILTMEFVFGTVEVCYTSSTFVVTKSTQGRKIKSKYVSPSIPIVGTQTVCLMLRKLNNAIEPKAEVVA